MKHSVLKYFPKVQKVTFLTQPDNKLAAKQFQRELQTYFYNINDFFKKLEDSEWMLFEK